jgi:predicted CXXCH cytochrome family protein
MAQRCGPSPARGWKSAQRARAAGIAAGVACALAWCGCSIQKHHGILSFFFDGVPNPNDLEGASAAERQAAMRQSPTYSVHLPYAQERCSDCHAGFTIARTADSGACLKCHQGKNEQYAFMHGPVAASACLWCHAPHESAFSHLLKKSPRDVCVQCHTPSMLNMAVVPEHSDPGANCISCHSGHGGEVRYFLHNSAAAPPPPGG